MSREIDLSIVIPTVNRARLLERGLIAIRDQVQSNAEVIVVDGASDDGTRGVLNLAKSWFGDRLKVVHEQRREGFVRAANKGFRLSTGRNLMWLNDDAWPVDDALDLAVAQMDHADSRTGLLAMFHRWQSMKNVAYELERDQTVYRLCHVRGTLYANFGIGRRETFERLGFFDERYFLYAADPDFSLKVWHAGLRVEPAYGACIDHDEVCDERRDRDADLGREDNTKLFAKWDLPARNLSWNDFDPVRPCTVRGLREAVQVAA